MLMHTTSTPSPHFRQAKYLLALSLLASLSMAGCGSSSGGDDGGTTDAGGTDSGMTDSGGSDGTTDGTTDGSTDGTTDGGGATVGLANCPSITGSGDASAIAGLYDVTVDTGFGTDVFYTEITATGNIISYDFLGDDFDQGDDCYLIESGLSALTATGGNTYTNLFYDDADLNCDTVTEVLTITSSSTSLTVQGPDFDDADNDGNTTEIITDTFPVLGLSTQDLNQCP